MLSDSDDDTDDDYVAPPRARPNSVATSTERQMAIDGPVLQGMGEPALPPGAAPHVPVDDAPALQDPVASGTQEETGPAAQLIDPPTPQVSNAPGVQGGIAPAAKVDEPSLQVVDGPVRMDVDASAAPASPLQEKVVIPSDNIDEAESTPLALTLKAIISRV